jgi:hypothetical protein
MLVAQMLAEWALVVGWRGAFWGGLVTGGSEQGRLYMHCALLVCQLPAI